MLEVHHLAVNYRGISAVKDVSFCLEPGQLVGVIGPNGAGKSTMVKAMLGLIPTESGEITFRSQSLQSQLAKVAYVPQRCQIDWDYPVTVKTVVMMARTRHNRCLRLPNRRSCLLVQSALHRVGMWDLRHRQIGTLSGGQQQRVFLARSLAQEAELFFFDEPFVGVDKQTEAIMFAVFEELCMAGKTLLVISHDLGVTTKAYDRFLLLNNKILADGSRDEVITAENLRRAYGDSVILLRRGEDE
jgi:manganese/iron transport system ATP-binding protein